MAAVNPAVPMAGRLGGRQRVELDQIVGRIARGVGISAVAAGADVVSVRDNAIPDREVGRRAGGHRACDVDPGDERIGPRHTTLRRDGQGVLVVDAGVLDGDL